MYFAFALLRLRKRRVERLRIEWETKGERRAAAAQEQLPGCTWPHCTLGRTLTSSCGRAGGRRREQQPYVRHCVWGFFFIFFLLIIFLRYSQFQFELFFRVVCGRRTCLRVSAYRLRFVAVYGNWSAHTKVNVRLGSAAQSKKYSAH